jgi:hypothetical protein
MTGARFRAAATVLALAAAPAAAQGVPDLVTDRPDQTESAEVVPVGTLQVELGALFTRDETGGERIDVLEGPGSLVRWGLSPRFELRFGWPGWIESEVESAGARHDRSGAGDPELGAKLELAALDAGHPLDLALLAHLTLPAGDDEVGSPRADPSLRLLGAHALSDRVGLGWNAGYEAASFEDAAGEVHTLGRFVYTAALGFDLAPRWGAFVELFGDLPASDPAPAAHSFDGGVTFLLTPTLQLDLAAGVGLDGDAPDRFVGAGLSLRVPR